MNDIIPGYIGRPFGGVSVICKDNALLNNRELESPMTVNYNCWCL